MAKFKEIPFKQEFDIIVKKERLTLDFEKDRYPGDTVCFYLNGTTGQYSTNINEILRDGVKYYIEDFNSVNNGSRKVGYSVEYDESQKILVFHLLKRTKFNGLRRGSIFVYKEFSRFLISNKMNVYIKKGGLKHTDRGNFYLDVDRYEKELKNDGEYETLYEFPFTRSAWTQYFTSYINVKDGSKSGFLKEASKAFPAVYNVSGNDYVPINSYEALLDYYTMTKDGITCTKKTGKKQDIIDELISYPLPDVEKPSKEEVSKYHDTYKYAVIQRVPCENPTCVIRTMNYIVAEDVLFEGGRIYVSKKDVEFCKKNNLGEYVTQPLLNKVHHWDFNLHKFPEETTKGTMLEYFGSIVPDIDIDNRSIAIWMFIKEPFMEQFAKIAGENLVNEFINLMRDTTEISTTCRYLLGIDSLKGKKIFQILGVSKQQFEEVKDLMVESMPQEYNDHDDVYSFTWGILPFIKAMLGNSFTADISSIDINTFGECLDFAIDIFYKYELSRKQYSRSYVGSINEAINSLIEIVRRHREIFPTVDVKYNYNLFREMFAKFKENDYYNRMTTFNLYRDYLNMVSLLEDKDHYKPKFENIEDLVNMHDNVQIIREVKSGGPEVARFEERHEAVWKKWEFKREEKKNKDGEIIQEALPFVVIAPKIPYDLAKEGTMLHHCVKSYISRVANGATNIMFIRQVSEPYKPFFTVEVDNNKIIQQVHGFSNCNADTVEGLEEFIDIWAKAKHLKTQGYNKVR